MFFLWTNTPVALLKFKREMDLKRKNLFPAQCSVSDGHRSSTHINKTQRTRCTSPSLLSTPRPGQPCSCKWESRISLLNLILLKAALNIDQTWRFSMSLVLQSARVRVPAPVWVMIRWGGQFRIFCGSLGRWITMKLTATIYVNWTEKLCGSIHKKHPLRKWSMKYTSKEH